MAEAGKNVVAFGSGLVLASLLVPVKKRITGVLEKIQYHDTYRSRRALLDIARDFSTPRTRAELVGAPSCSASRTASTSCPARSSCSTTRRSCRPSGSSSPSASTAQEIWRLRGAALRPGDEPAGRRAAPRARLPHLLRAALRRRPRRRARRRAQGRPRAPLVGGRVACSTAVMAQAGLAYENARLYGALAERLEEIRSLQQYQESVIRSSSSGILVLDGEDRVHSANPAFAAHGRPRRRRSWSAGRSREVLPGVERAPLRRTATGATIEATLERARRRGARPARLGLRLPGRAGPPGRPRRRRDRPGARRAGPRGTRATRLARRARGRRRARGQHADRRPLLLRAAAARRHGAGRPALRDPEEDGAADLPRGAPRQQPARVRAARARAPTSRTDLREVIANAAESVETTFGSAAPARSKRTRRGARPGSTATRASSSRSSSTSSPTRATPPPTGGEVSCRLATTATAARVTVADRGAGRPAGDAARGSSSPSSRRRSRAGRDSASRSRARSCARHGGEIGLAPPGRRRNRGLGRRCRWPEGSS